MPESKPYYKFSDYLKECFDCRVHKVGVDAGFSCPNRDGSKGYDGCIYCNNQGFSFNSRSAPRAISEQIEQGIQSGRKRFKAKKFLVYFQAYTNTYAPLEQLRQKYDTIKSFPDVVGMAIGTRADCIDEPVLDLIASYADKYQVWLEYGLQSIHPRSLELINRGHLYQDFLGAIALTKLREKIKICAHVILGLPGETKAEMLATAEELARLRLDGVKIHPLHIIKETKLAAMYQAGQYQPINEQEYIDLSCGFLERLWPGTVIQRITADCPRQLLVGPEWILEKNKVLKKIENTLLENGQFQGRLYRE